MSRPVLRLVGNKQTKKSNNNNTLALIYHGFVFLYDPIQESTTRELKQQTIIIN